MDNRSYRHEYIEQYVRDERFTEKTIVTKINFWKRIEKAEKEIGKSLEEGYTKKDYINLFSKLKLATPHSLNPRKTTIRHYVEWLQTQGVLGDDPLSALDSVSYRDLDIGEYYDEGYFKDFGSLHDQIESALIATEVVDDRRYGTEITAIYLAWCGVTAEEAIDIKKEDVHEDYISVSGRIVRPIPAIMSYINEYKEETEYNVMLPQGIGTYKYVWSEYLLRSTRRDHIQVAKHLRALLLMFSNKAGASKTLFPYNKIYWSGIYHRAYLYECANGPLKPGDMKALGDIFGEKYTYVQDANKRLYAYQQYRDYFFPSAKQS